MTKITIFHTNDVHSQFNRLASIQAYLLNHKKTTDILLDAGDFHDFKDIMITGTKGKAGKSILNHMEYDAICVGNNEGYSGIECLQEMSLDNVPLLSVNLTYLDGLDLPFLKKSCIITKESIRFLIIGVTPYYNLENNDGYNAFFKLENLKSNNPIQCIENERNKYHNQYDFIIVLSHLGITYDQKIAQELDGIDIIIGGHSHTLMESPLIVNNCIIHQAGAYAQYCGRLDLNIEHNKIQSFEGKCIEINEIEDEDILKLREEKTYEARQNMSQIIRVSHDLDFDPIRENRTINFICDALYNEVECDFALMNHGIISYPIAQSISELSLLESCPSPLNPTLIEVFGYQIIQAFQDSFNEELCLSEGRGPGFRGLFVGALSVSYNVRVHQSPFIITINNELIDENRCYKVMTSDYLQRGTGYRSLKVDNKDSIFYNGYIRDVIKRNIMNDDLLNQSKIKRIIKVFDNN
jgi:2',3'-cyclic-nucleotide 2'-phosphodiesterase (5'-nucleotidase family)